MLSQSRPQRQRLQRCRIYLQVGDKSHWNSRERVLEPEELSFLQATDSDTETREGAKRAAEGASPLTYAWANTSLTLAPQCLHSPSNSCGLSFQCWVFTKVKVSNEIHIKIGAYLALQCIFDFSRNEVIK